MKPAVVIDTNVAMVANGKHEAAGPKCEQACVDALRQAINQVVLLDEQLEILDEYRRNMNLSGQPGVGNAFFKWLWNNQANHDCCRMIPITRMGENYAEFPTDPDLRRFDPSDRKFVAVALASKMNPAILNASDTDWWTFRLCLARNGVNLTFLCPELMGSGEG